MHGAADFRRNRWLMRGRLAARGARIYERSRCVRNCPSRCALATIAVAKPAESQTFLRPRRRSSAMPIWPISRSARRSSRICSVHGADRSSARDAPNVRAGLPPLPGRGRGRRADSRRRRLAPAGQLSRRPCRTIRAASPPRLRRSERVAGPRRAACPTIRASCGCRARRPAALIRPATAERLRAIVREARAADAPPRITGIGRAFHVPGSLPGESETQIFLQTADSRPISLSVLRRPGEQPRWSVALGRDRRRGRRPRPRPTPCSGTASPAPCRRACRRRAAGARRGDPGR